jgi:two-component sensor histidine kinase
MRKNFIAVILMIGSYQAFSQNSTIDSLKVVLLTSTDTTQVFVLNELAKASEFIDPQALFDYSLRAKALAEKINYKHGLARALCNIGTYYSKVGATSKSIDFYQRALTHVDPKKDHYLNMILLYNLSTRETKDPESKISNLNKAITIAKQINFNQIGFLYYSMGTYYYNRSEHQQAFTYYLQALKEAEKFKDSVAIAIALDGIGSILEQNYDSTAYQFRLSALKMAVQTKSELFISVCQTSLSDYYVNMGKLDSALVLIQEGLRLSKKINYPEGVARNLNNLGKVYHKKHHHNQALYYYKQAIDYLMKCDLNHTLKNDLANTYLNIGTTYNASGNHTEAIFYLEKSLGIVDHQKLKTHLIDVYHELSQAYYNISNFKKAYEYQDLNRILYDSVYNVETGKRIALMQSRHELEKKEKDIKALQQHNSIKDLTIAQSKSKLILLYCFCGVALIVSVLLLNRYRFKQKANAKMEKSNNEITKMMKEKEVLIQEIHHRTKNNLQLVSSLLSWQTENIEDEKMVRILNEGRSRIKSMALIHELLYQSNSLSHVELNIYILKLLEYLEKIYNTNRKVTIIKTVSPVLVDIDVTIPLGLIVTELVSNSFKYAFGEDHPKIIEVSLFEEKPYVYQLRIKDNGIGIPDEIINERRPKSMGLELVKILVKQIKGHVDYYNNNGANFCISFTNVHYKEKVKEVV